MGFIGINKKGKNLIIMKNFSEYLLDKYGVWGWLGQRAHDAEGIHNILPLDFIISCDFGLEIDHFHAKKDVYSIEKKNKIRKNWSNEDLGLNLKDSFGSEIFDRWARTQKDINILCYRSIKYLERKRFGLKNKIRIYSASEKLKKYFDNKILFYKALNSLEVPRIPGEVIKLGKEKFESISSSLSVPFVIQFPYGSSGNSTFFIKNKNEYIALQKKHPSSIVAVKKYIDGYSLNVNGIIVSGEKGPFVRSSIPSGQLVGIPECSSFLSSFCGNDYSMTKNINKKILKEVDLQTKKTGIWMAEKGFRGIFGMDFVIDHDQTVYPVEINPRFQNSTGLYTTIFDINRDDNYALFLLHIAEFLQQEDTQAREYIKNFPYEELLMPVNGAQVILHNRRKRKNTSGVLTPGIYNFIDNDLKFISRSASLRDCKKEEDILITCGLPEKDMVIEPDAPICKVQRHKSMLDNENKRYLTEEMKLIVSSVYSKLGLTEEIFV